MMLMKQGLLLRSPPSHPLSLSSQSSLLKTHKILKPNSSLITIPNSSSVKDTKDGVFQKKSLTIFDFQSQDQRSTSTSTYFQRSRGMDSDVGYRKAELQPLIERGMAERPSVMPFRESQLSNKERLLLRKQALSMKKRPVLAIGKSNVVSGVAKATNEHFQKYPLAIVNIKGRAKGTSIQEVIYNLEERFNSRLPTTTVIVSNALLMFAKPMEALAETCEADNSVFNMNMPLLLFVALIGATVGGLLARQRKGELQRLNEQLRQINTALRRQAKIESYAPNLSYAPINGRIAENEVIVDPRKHELISRLKNGKNFLRNQEPDKAFSEFKTALELAQNLDDKTEAKKAARGLGASLQRQGKYRDAIKYHSMVLEISEREGEESGNAEAYGAIADCYTELGDLERAAKYYDQYIGRLQSD